MATTQSKLDILINAKNNASPAVKQIGVDLKEMDRAAGSLAKGLGGLAAGAGIAGLLALGSAAASATFELGQLGAMSLQVEGSFEGTSARLGSSADEMLSAMRAASRGMIDDQALMLGANRAMVLGVATNLEEMGALLEVAGARAKIMGTDVASAYNDLVTGIGRMSPLILDNLGIVTGGEKVFEDYAASIGKTADQLTDAERKQVLLNMAIRDTLPYLEGNVEGGDNAAASFQRFSASITNLRTNLGEMIAIRIAPWLDAISGAMNRLAKTIEFFAKGGNLSNPWAVQNFANMMSGAEQTSYAQEVLAQATEEAASAANTQAASFETLQKAYDSANRSIANLAAGQFGNLGATGVLSMQQSLTDEMGVQVRLWQEMGYSGEQIANTLLPGWLDAQRDITRETTATGHAAKQVNAEYSDLVNKAKSVLSGALKTGVTSADSLLEEMGLREDALSEDARRLADVATRGWESPWADYFRTRFPRLFDDMYFNPGSIKEIAARQLKDFEDGLNPELIDRERAKERIRRMLIGESNLKEMATEIANELAAEMGIPLEQALAAAQGTLGTRGAQGGAGTDAAQSFSDGARMGLEETNAGGALVDTFISQMRASYSKLKSAGRDAGKEWGDGFVAVVGENVPPALVNLLTELVTPGVMSKFAQQGSLQGAAN